MGIKLDKASESRLSRPLPLFLRGMSFVCLRGRAALIFNELGFFIELGGLAKNRGCEGTFKSCCSTCSVQMVKERGTGRCTKLYFCCKSCHKSGMVFTVDFMSNMI